MTRRILLALTFAALLLSSHRALAAPGIVDPCTLFSQQEAAALFGAPLDPGLSMAGICAYFGAHRDDKKGISITLFDSDRTAPGTLQQMYNAMMQAQPGRTITAFGGLADKANFLTDSDQMTILAQYHGKLISITAFDSHNPQLKDALVQAMRQILRKV